MDGRRTMSLRLVAATAALVPALLFVVFWETEVSFPGWVHFLGVGVAAAAATAAAIALTVAGALNDDARAVLAGLAFSLMAALLCLHGVATPGFIVERNGVVAFTGAATLPVGCVVLALGSLSVFRRPEIIRSLVIALVAGAVGLLALGASAILFPLLVPRVPRAGSPLAVATLVVGAVAVGLLALRAIRTYRLTQRRSDLIVLVGIAWLGVALVGALMRDYSYLPWWIGHVLEVGGIALVGIPVARDLRLGVTQQSRTLVGDLRGEDLVTSAEAFLGSHVRALLISLAAKDASTEEHTRRVALLAARVGDELGLPPGRLRNLATGGLLHDVGKLALADEVLKKPLALTEAEFEEIKRHPETGVRLLREVGGFGDAVLTLVRDHHERLDGSGYPAGSCGGDLTLDARILAACDVYDALVSPRVYRDAWTPAQAMELLVAGIDTEFDGKVVRALAKVVGGSDARMAPASAAAVRTSAVPAR